VPTSLSDMTPTLRFCLKFAAFLVVLLAAFETSRGTAFERFVVDDAILAPTAALLDTLAPSDRAALNGRTIVWGGAQLRVTRGCEGVELFLLLAGAVAAFPATLERRFKGLLVGFALAYLLSIARLLILAATLRYSPGVWESMHGLIMPLAPVLALALYFLRWSGATAVPAVRAPRAA